MGTREKSGDAQNLASAADRWIRRFGRSRSLSVATLVGDIAVGRPVNGTVEIAGPEQFRIDELVRRRLAQLGDPREVIADSNALYSGAKINDSTLVPGHNARIGETRFETWLTQSAAKAA